MPLLQLFYSMCRKYPDVMQRHMVRCSSLSCLSIPNTIWLLKMFSKVGVVLDFLGQHYSRHFTPSYQPWDQRVCVLPNADLMQAIKANRASVVTDRIAGVVVATESLALFHCTCNAA